MESVTAGNCDRRKVGGAGRKGLEGDRGGDRERRVFPASDAGARGLREGNSADISRNQRLSREDGRPLRFEFVDWRGRNGVFPVSDTGEDRECAGDVGLLTTDAFCANSVPLVLIVMHVSSLRSTADC